MGYKDRNAYEDSKPIRKRTPSEEARVQENMNMHQQELKDIKMEAQKKQDNSSRFGNI